MRLTISYYVRLKMLTIIFCFLIGCEQSHELNKITIDVQDIANVSVHECFDRIELLPLETKEGAFIKYIMKIKKYEGCYFIIDFNKNVYKIDGEGKFICEIGGIGRGPEEHLEVVDIQINKYTNNLELLMPRGRIDVFSTDGLFLESMPLDTYAHEFINISEDLVLIHFSVGAYNLSFYSRSEGKVIAQEYPMEDEINKKIPLGDTAPIWQWNGDVYFHSPFSNTIFKLNGKQLVQYYTLDCGEYNFDISNFSLETGLDRKQYSEKIRESKDIATYFHFHIETDKFILKRFLNGDIENMPSFLFDKTTSETRVFVDFVEGIRLPKLYHYDPKEEIVYAAVEPGDIQKHIFMGLLDENDVEKLKNIEISDNPVLVAYHLK